MVEDTSSIFRRNDSETDLWLYNCLLFLWPAISNDIVFFMCVSYVTQCLRKNLGETVNGNMNDKIFNYGVSTELYCVQIRYFNADWLCFNFY